MNTKLRILKAQLESEIELIPNERRTSLDGLVSQLLESQEALGEIKLISVCTHNSRRSQLMQILLQFLADCHGLTNFQTYSGGTEGTAFNHRMVDALRHYGFDLLVERPGDNPVYQLYYEQEEPKADYFFSKRYDNAYNPTENFIAVMVCMEADAECPFVPGAFRRFSLPYEDPKQADDTPKEEEAYRNKVLEIGREMAYVINQFVG